MQAQMRQAMPKRYFCPVRSTSVSVTNSLIGAQLNTPTDLAALCTLVLSIKAGRSTQMSYAPCVWQALNESVVCVASAVPACH